jgi:hypothetical protein
MKNKTRAGEQYDGTEKIRITKKLGLNKLVRKPKIYVIINVYLE